MPLDATVLSCVVGMLPPRIKLETIPNDKLLCWHFHLSHLYRYSLNVHKIGWADITDMMRLDKTEAKLPDCQK